MKYLLFLFTIASLAFCEEDYYSFGKTGVKPVDNQLYMNECASCHFGYQPGLLPSKSWDKVMNNLSNHFGTDASLAKEDFDEIYKYIMDNSAEKAMNYKRSKRIVNSLADYVNNPVDAITKVPYFIRKHREIPKRVIEQEEVKSLSNCIACHKTADKAYYNEGAIRIPNYRKWED